jgi:hypothetical protein
MAVQDLRSEMIDLDMMKCRRAARRSHHLMVRVLGPVAAFCRPSGGGLRAALGTEIFRNLSATSSSEDHDDATIESPCRIAVSAIRCGGAL